MKIALSSDHRGFEAKERLAHHLTGAGYEVEDCGCDGVASCDYPDFGLKAAKRVADGDAALGILLCGTGIGMSITANKVHGVRAALCHDELTAQLARKHNDANVLCLPADLVGEELIKRLVDVWLETKFEGGRHERRVEKIRNYEENGVIGE
jgi:ribose 5-phosphate isomerase B